MGKPKLMIIEDNSDIVLLYRTIIKRHFDFDIVEANSIKDAKNLLKATFPDLVILDVCLPDGEGFDIAPEIKTANENVKILVVTAFGHCVEKQKTKEIGAHALLSKPFESATFVEHLQAMLNAD